MRNVRPTMITLNGQFIRSGVSAFLDPLYLFKGKLRACATRGKFHDSADLRWLEDRYHAHIKPHIHELNIEYIGLAIKRYTELELLFNRLGVDVAGAKHAVRKMDLKKLPPPAVGDVQEGILG
jgi:hypothetical protein